LAEEGEDGIQSPKQKFWMDKFSHNHENLISVLKYFEMNDEIEKLAQMAGFLGHFWQYKGLFTEGIGWYRRILDIEIRDENLFNNIRIGLGRLLVEFGQYEESRKILINVLKSCTPDSINYNSASYEFAWTLYFLNSFQEAEAQFRILLKNRDKVLRAKSELGLGSIKWRSEEITEAEQYFLSSISILTNYGEPRSIAQASNNLGIIYYQRNIMDKAEIYFKQAKECFYELGEEDNLRNVLNNLGYLAFQREDYKLSIKYFKELTSLLENSGNDLLLSLSYTGLASSNLELGNIDIALSQGMKSFELINKISHCGEFGICLRVLGDIWFRKEDYIKARNYYLESIPILKENKEDEDLVYAIDGLRKLEQFIDI